MDNRALLCQYGKAKRLFRIADVSNGDFEDVSSRTVADFGFEYQIERIFPLWHDQPRRWRESTETLRS